MRAKKPSIEARETDLRVDTFVEAVNSSPRVPLFREEIPAECLLSGTELPGVHRWRMARSGDAGWLPAVEHLLPFGLPRTFRSLIARYLFPSFEVGPLTLFSVGVGHPNAQTMEFRVAAFRDRHMAPFLLKSGFIPFARPADLSYDPVCFDFRASHRKPEPAVVRIDHEEILCNERPHILEVVSPSFPELIEQMTKELRVKASVESQVRPI